MNQESKFCLDAVKTDTNILNNEEREEEEKYKIESCPRSNKISNKLNLAEEESQLTNKDTTNNANVNMGVMNTRSNTTSGQCSSQREPNSNDAPCYTNCNPQIKTEDIKVEWEELHHSIDVKEEIPYLKCEKQFMCEICGRLYASQADFKNHVKKRHSCWKARASWPKGLKTSGCAVKYCSSVYNGTISFFRFPRNLVRCKDWLMLCSREEFSKINDVNYFHHNLRVCALHFENRMFLNDLHNRLQPHARPIL